ncbi:MAG TPA: hypothetical protein VMK65_11155 [Longimicrobiales bacterium]|nr:hypothetical protein [Longimicrobiales bacterium]
MAAVFALPLSAQAQESGGRELRLGALLGWGEGPSATAAAGVRVGVGLGSGVALELEYSRWGHGIPGGCDGINPRCHGDGHLYLAGVAAGWPIMPRLEGHLQLNAGVHDLSGVPRGEAGAGPKASFAVDLGARIEATDRVGFQVKGRFLDVFGDAAYTARVGEPLRYGMLMVGVEYALPI